ncbi:cyclic AMP-responsive element-binding protein 3-like protein 4 [Genypterus blacodes]|uniref:cyclic AMP-responsive element-binding protein 3-like protein 4 n=1 Tax=Genypterus blacodes TaxID=154954 RepID=UPI003F759ED4
MDAEGGELFLSGGEATDSWGLDAAFSCSQSELVFDGSERPLRDWVGNPQCTLSDSESEDVLHAVDPNEVFPNGPPADSSSESDSGISEDPVVECPVTTATGRPAPPTVYQVVYDISSLGNVKTEPGQSVDLISIELDDWSSQVLFSDSCVVNELPLVSRLEGSLAVCRPAEPTFDLPSLHGDSVRTGSSVTEESWRPSGAHSSASSSSSSAALPELQLTEEEQKLLTQEGVSLPNSLPLTKAEERVLKRVRRKIRNKQSAQDSRRRRKEYIDGLENRAASCSAQNKELQRTVEHLEKHNISLLTQLRKLQTLIKQTASKGAQTSTCLLIILVSLALILIPTLSPFSRSWSAEEDYRPTGVISRNILTDSAPSVPTPDEADVQTLPPAPPSDPDPSGPLDGGGGIQRPIEVPEAAVPEGGAKDGSQSGNSSSVVAGQSEPPPPSLRSAGGKGSSDPGKPAHADEM